MIGVQGEQGGSRDDQDHLLRRCLVRAVPRVRATATGGRPAGRIRRPGQRHGGRGTAVPRLVRADRHRAAGRGGGGPLRRAQRVGVARAASSAWLISTVTSANTLTTRYRAFRVVSSWDATVTTRDRRVLAWVSTRLPRM